MVVCILVAAFEVQVRLYYGSNSYEFLINLMYSYFPAEFTVGQNMKLTRNLFPLLFQLVLILCDVTVDAKAKLTPEEVEEQKKLDNVYVEMLTR